MFLDFAKESVGKIIEKEDEDDESNESIFLQKIIQSN